MADRVVPPARPAKTRGPIRQFVRGQQIYFWHVLGLLAPGQEIPVYAAHQIKPTPIDSWEDDDLEKMVEEGRRQLDRQLGDLERIRGRAQWLFTVSAGITAALGGALTSAQLGGALLAVWVLALVVLLLGAGAAAGIMTVRADFATIDTAKLSQAERPLLKSLATNYSRMLGRGENTVATRLTVFRQAVVYVIVGRYLGLLAFMLHR
jgi:hypothetical protein